MNAWNRIHQCLTQTEEDRSTFYTTALLLFLFSLIVRGFLVWNSQVIGGDAVTYVLEGKELAKQPLTSVVTRVKFLFPLLVEWMSSIFGTSMLAGGVLNVICSSAVVVFLYGLFRDHTSRPVALLAALVYILHPVVVDRQTKVTSDALFMCFFFASVYLFHRYVQEHSYPILSLTGSFVAALVALATRPEAGLLFFLHSCYLLVQIGIQTRQGTLKYEPIIGVTLYFVLPIGIGLLIIGDPFLDLLMNPGAYSENLNNLLAVISGQAAVDPIRKWPWYKVLIEEFSRLSYYHLNLFLLIGLYWVPWSTTDTTKWFYGSYIILYYLAVFLSGLGNPSHTYVNERYLMPGFFLLMPVIGKGIIETYHYLDQNGNRRKIAVSMVLISLIGLTPRTLEKGVLPRNYEKQGLKQAGQFIADQDVPSPVLLATSKPPAYYAGARWSNVHILNKDQTNASNLRDMLSRKSIDYIVIEMNEWKDHPIMREIKRLSNVEAVFRYKSEQDDIDPVTVYVVRHKELKKEKK